MAVVHTRYVKGATDLALSGTWTSGGAPSTPWSAASDVTFDEGGPVVFTSPTALAAINLEFVKFQAGFTSPVGSSTNYIQFWINNDASALFDYNGGATAPCYFEGAAAQPQWNELWWRPTAGALGNFKGVAVQTTTYADGPMKIDGTSTVLDIRTSSGGSVDIAENTGDTVRNIDAWGLSSVYCRRGMTGTTKIGPGATVTIDFDGSCAGTFELAGGTLVHIRGNIVVTGNAGVYDATRLQRVYTLSIADAPDLLERYGSVKPTITRSKTWGDGSSQGK